MVGVRGIGDVYDERRGPCLVGTITAEERRAGAETQVDEGAVSYTHLRAHETDS